MDANRADILDVIRSYYFDCEKISLNNIGVHINNYEQMNMHRKKYCLVQLFGQKLEARKVQPLSLFKMADVKNTGTASKQ